MCFVLWRGGVGGCAFGKVIKKKKKKRRSKQWISMMQAARIMAPRMQATNARVTAVRGLNLARKIQCDVAERRRSDRRPKGLPVSVRAGVRADTGEILLGSDIFSRCPARWGPRPPLVADLNLS